jgi:tryptophanyl-tRNA synthetase
MTTYLVRKKVMKMFTDPSHIRADISGDPENNPVFIYHRVFNPNKSDVGNMEDLYRKGMMGDVAVKEKLFEVLESFISPIRAKSRELRSDQNRLLSILREGTLKSELRVKTTVTTFMETTGLVRQ